MVEILIDRDVLLGGGGYFCWYLGDDAEILLELIGYLTSDGGG